MTSNQALQKVRNLFRAEKAGHTGALDPLATGVLPICLGEATKVAGLLLGNDKAYEVIAALGTTTDTDDADGPVLRQRSIGSYAREQVEALLPQFTGDIMQVPPVYSALKQGGEPMYLKARRGDEIDLPARPVRIHDIELLTLEPAQFSLRVTCGSGTYIRSLIRDLGEALGCGAHVTALHRLWVEPFQALPLRTLDGLQALAEQGLPELDAVLHPVAEALVAVPRLVLDDDQARRVGMGQKIRIPEPFAASERVQLCNVAGLPLGLAGISADGHLTVQRLFRWAAIN
jgi:tRNA pseudouridine55 synthase